MKNFSINKDGKEYWISRSVACAVIVFAFDRNKKLHVLANLRGEGSKVSKGMWNIPGGFIDYGENAEQCACRECFEETGIQLDPENISFIDVNTDPAGERQTISIRFVTILDKFIDEVVTTNEYSEPDEVAEIKWFPVDTDEDMKNLENYQWTRDQLKYIGIAQRYLVDSGLYDFGRFLRFG